MKRWRKQPSEIGLARICQSTRGLELRENGKILVHVAPLRDGRWYWCGFGQNTCGSPVKTKEEAKAEVIKFMKDNIEISCRLPK